MALLIFFVEANVETNSPEKHTVVIIGAGTGGIAVAAGLKRHRPELDIAIIDPAHHHDYQPAWTLVGGGSYRAEHTRRELARCLPRGVRFINGAASTLDPDGQQVDLADGRSVTYDILIVGAAAVTLIFIVMLLITRALVASAVIVGTVLLSLSAAFGLTVVVWQHILGLQLNWIAPVFGVIILLAVGSDYNLLLVSRFSEEIGAGIKTGIIRSIGGTGSVVTAAGLVFAFTMMSMAASDLYSIGQAGSTIGLGLLFDTLIVRSFLTPSIAALLGRWFWWPLNVRQRPVPQKFGDSGTQQLALF